MVYDAVESAILGSRSNGGSNAMFNLAYGGLKPESLSLGDTNLPKAGTLGFSSSDIYGPTELNPSKFPQGVQSAIKAGENISFTTPSENSKSNKQPDYIMNAEGKIVPNPKNPHPGKNGSLNIEIDASNGGKNSAAEAAKIDAQLQKQAAQEMISYFEHFNPGKPIPQEYLNILNNTNIPGLDNTTSNPQQPTDSSSQAAQPSQPVDNPPAQQPTSSDSSAGGSTAGGGGGGAGDSGAGGGGGGYSGGGGGGGYSGGGGGGGYSGGGGGPVDAGAAGSGPSSSAALSGSGDGMLTQKQVIFADELAKKTGMDTRVIAAWMLNEESGSAAQQRDSQNNNDWLNIGYTDSATLGANNAVWSDPKQAADATAAWMKGTWSDPGFGTSSQGIQDILKTVGQSPDAQIAAIQGSGWASGGESSLPQLFQEVSAQFPNGNINTGNATEVAGLSVSGGSGSAEQQKIEAAGMNVGGAEGTVGSCLKGVEDSLDSIGINLPRLPEAKDMIPVLQQDPQFKEVPADQAKPGDIAVYGDSQALAASGGAGHITILEPNGQEASDHIQGNVQGFGTPTVFEYVGNGGTQVAAQSAKFEIAPNGGHDSAAGKPAEASAHAPAKPAAKPEAKVASAKPAEHHVQTTAEKKTA